MLEEVALEPPQDRPVKVVQPFPGTLVTTPEPQRILAA